MRRMPPIPNLSGWLRTTPSAQNGLYRHQLVSEAGTLAGVALAEVKRHFEAAHEDALKHYQKSLGIDLRPVPAGTIDPSTHYPKKLHISTLQAYLGEIMAGLVAENFSPCGESWEVPAYLLRWHSTAFQRLEKCLNTGEEAGPIPGRTGDDCLAFVRDADGKITKVLFCESKCTGDHDTHLIADGFKKLNEQSVSMMELISILREREDEEAKKWVDALINARMNDRLASGSPEQCDMLCYVYSRAPVRNATWLNTSASHRSYTAARRLEAVEVRVGNTEDLVKLIYDLSPR